MLGKTAEIIKREYFDYKDEKYIGTIETFPNQFTFQILNP